jgi:Oxidoreductase molybdopterin binding domain/Pentapeptide repeats (8 copies)
MDAEKPKRQGLLPPNQALAAPGKWPLVGETLPPPPAQAWRVCVEGLVEKPQQWDIPTLAAMAQQEWRVDIHCVTRWSRLGVAFSGVALASLLSVCQPLPTARFVSFTAWSPRQHKTSLPLEAAHQALLALSYEGGPLPPEHGGPVRIIMPGRYFYKSLKWLWTLTLRAEDELGYWEANSGYHNNADPWAEERYITRQIDHRRLAELLLKRDFSGQDLLNLMAMRQSLPGLKARAALLRHADFRYADLRGADFCGANLSNACFVGASLQQANFTQADCEGADFCGADLRGADFRGASLFGATFVPEWPRFQDPLAPDPSGPVHEPSTPKDGGALLQGASFSHEQRDRLSLAQQAYLCEASLWPKSEEEP